MRRVRPKAGSQLALLTLYAYHPFITDRAGDRLALEADHRRHAEIENAIRDLKYGMGLNHLPSGKFAANAAWLAVQVIAHNLARWTARIGLGAGIVTAKTLRRRLFALVRAAHPQRPAAHTPPVGATGHGRPSSRPYSRGFGRSRSSPDRRISAPPPWGPATACEEPGGGGF